MPLSPIIVSLPIADRRTSFTFYGEGLGLDAIGELADDGVPEPLQFALGTASVSCSSLPAARLGHRPPRGGGARP